MWRLGENEEGNGIMIVHRCLARKHCIGGNS